MLGRTPRSLLALSLAIAAGSCDAEQATPNPDDGMDAGKPQITPSLTALMDGGCAELIAVPHASPPYVLPITVTLSGTSAGQFVLRPPGYCSTSSSALCGHLVATVSPPDPMDPLDAGTQSQVVRSGSPVIEVRRSVPAELTITITVQNDDGALLAEAPPVHVSARTSCAPVTDGSSSSSGGGMGGGSSSSSSGSGSSSSSSSNSSGSGS